MSTHHLNVIGDVERKAAMAIGHYIHMNMIKCFDNHRHDNTYLSRSDAALVDLNRQLDELLAKHSWITQMGLHVCHQCIERIRKHGKHVITAFKLLYPGRLPHESDDTGRKAVEIVSRYLITTLPETVLYDIIVLRCPSPNATFNFTFFYKGLSKVFRLFGRTTAPSERAVPIKFTLPDFTEHSDLQTTNPTLLTGYHMVINNMKKDLDGAHGPVPPLSAVILNIVTHVANALELMQDAKWNVANLKSQKYSQLSRHLNAALLLLISGTRVSRGNEILGILHKNIVYNVQRKSTMNGVGVTTDVHIPVVAAVYIPELLKLPMYALTVHKGKHMKSDVDTVHYTLPEFASLLSVPHLLRLLVIAHMWLDERYMDPTVNKSGMVFRKLYIHKSTKRNTDIRTGDIVCDTLCERDNADANATGFPLTVKSYNTYACRYAFANVMVGMNVSAKINANTLAFYRRNGYGHTVNSKTIEKRYAVNHQRLILNDKDATIIPCEYDTSRTAHRTMAEVQELVSLAELYHKVNTEYKSKHVQSYEGYAAYDTVIQNVIRVLNVGGDEDERVSSYSALNTGPIRDNISLNVLTVIRQAPLRLDLDRVQLMTDMLPKEWVDKLHRCVATIDNIMTGEADAADAGITKLPTHNQTLKLTNVMRLALYNPEVLNLAKTTVDTLAPDLIQESDLGDDDITEIDANDHDSDQERHVVESALASTRKRERSPEPEGDTPKAGSKPKGDTPKAGSKPNEGSTPKTGGKPKGDASKTGGKPKGDASKTGGKPKGDASKGDASKIGSKPNNGSKPKGDTSKGDTSKTGGKPKGKADKMKHPAPLTSSEPSFEINDWLVIISRSATDEASFPVRCLCEGKYNVCTVWVVQLRTFRVDRVTQMYHVSGRFLKGQCPLTEVSGDLTTVQRIMFSHDDFVLNLGKPDDVKIAVRDHADEITKLACQKGA